MRTQLDPAAPATAEPVDVEGVEWAFTDDENESAYADILSAYDDAAAPAM
jgi:hypothetical protein